MIIEPTVDYAQPGAGDGLGKAVSLFERQYLTGSFYFFRRFSLYLAQPLSFSFAVINPK